MEYGIIGGNKVNFLAERINEEIVEGDILGIARWNSIEHFQQTLRANKEILLGLDKIVILDGALREDHEDLNNRDIANRALGDFLRLEALIKRDLRGVFLLLYTKSPILDVLVNNHYKRDAINRYEGTVNQLTTTGYQAQSLARVFETKYEMMDSEEKDLGSKAASEDLKRKVAEQAEIYKLMGQREELRSQVDALNKKMDLVDRQLNSYLMGDREDDLDVLSELVGRDTQKSTSIEDEIELLLDN